MLSYLPQVYETIVKPMTQRLKQLAMEMNFGCEAEIFSSDLRFKMFDDSANAVYVGSQPMKSEDAMQCLKARLNNMIEIF